VASIQREQNAIIRDEEPGTLIIQGVAGSGKTSIALHRIAYLLYRQRERLSVRSVAIISPSRVFSDYISGVLPELGEEPVAQWAVPDLAARLLAGVARVQPAYPWADEADAARAARVAEKATQAFADDLVAWLEAATAPDAAEPLLAPRDLMVGTTCIEASWLADRYAGYGAVPVAERLDLLAADAVSEALAHSHGRAAAGLPTRREVRCRLARMLRARDALALYRRFLADTARSALLRPPARGVLEWEDAFPVALCRLALEGMASWPEVAAVRHVVVDEMQDLTPVQHAAVARLFPCDRTILGDVSQVVDGRGACEPEAVAAAYPGARLVRLMRSYRSTFEITSLAARVRPVRGLEAVERHGPQPRLIRCGDTRGVIEAVGDSVREWRAAGGRTLGVICRSDLLAARYAEVLGAELPVTLIAEGADAFPGGIAVGSVRAVKGLEFDDVVVLDADARQYASEPDRSLLYVALTRALHRLTVLYRDEPSPFLG
ncbi:MAG: ATP-binding domain-containing protein, partial [Eggerthellaceae bacterium]|nr:ATP-binding domain-containing protein [Eggerthellaceae bacterium]